VARTHAHRHVRMSSLIESLVQRGHSHEAPASGTTDRARRPGACSGLRTPGGACLCRVGPIIHRHGPGYRYRPDACQPALTDLDTLRDKYQQDANRTPEGNRTPERPLNRAFAPTRKQPGHNPPQNHWSRQDETHGGADGTRTRDPRTASAVRYQLRYSPEGITTAPPRCVGHRTRGPW
jgi:hypothetical protein